MTIDTDQNNFVGYDSLTKESEIYDIQNINDKDIVLFAKDNPFYFEAGGQVSDEGLVVVDGTEIPIKKLIQTNSGAVGVVIESPIINVGESIVQKVSPDSVSYTHLTLPTKA